MLHLPPLYSWVPQRGAVDDCMYYCTAIWLKMEKVCAPPLAPPAPPLRTFGLVSLRVRPQVISLARLSCICVVDVPLLLRGRRSTLYFFLRRRPTEIFKNADASDAWIGDHRVRG